MRTSTEKRSFALVEGKQFEKYSFEYFLLLICYEPPKTNLSSCTNIWNRSCI